MPIMKKQDIQNQLQKALRKSPTRSYVYRISLFGSHLHGTANNNSDIDLLIELYEPISMLKLVHMERELTGILGKNVDLCTPKSLSRYFRDDVVREAELLYESAE